MSRDKACAAAAHPVAALGYQLPALRIGKASLKINIATLLLLLLQASNAGDGSNKAAVSPSAAAVRDVRSAG
jgi:hypothetical protein